MFCRLSDTVRQFGHKKRNPPVPKSEVISVERIGPNNTHPEHFARGVVEHPESDSCLEGGPGASAKGGSHAVFHSSILDIWVGRDL